MDQRLFFPATERNRQSIKVILETCLPKEGTVLEIASGSGQHAVWLQKFFSKIIWQASDPETLHRMSINAWIKEEGLRNIMPPPLDIDVESQPWPLPLPVSSTISAIVCINLIHVSPWSSAEALFQGASSFLNSGSPFFLYGPFKRKGRHTSQSNENFDKSLKLSNPLWGVRDLERLNKLSLEKGFENHLIYEMPANNLSIVYYKK